MPQHRVMSIFDSYFSARADVYHRQLSHKRALTLVSWVGVVHTATPLDAFRWWWWVPGWMRSGRASATSHGQDGPSLSLRVGGGFAERGGALRKQKEGHPVQQGGAVVGLTCRTSVGLIILIAAQAGMDNYGMPQHRVMSIFKPYISARADATDNCRTSGR